MSEMNFFLGLHVTQAKDSNFINQKKYIKKILKKLAFEDMQSIRTPIEKNHKLEPIGDRNLMDQTYYRSLIGSFVHLTTSGIEIMFVVCLFACFLSNPK